MGVIWITTTDSCARPTHPQMCLYKSPYHKGVQNFVCSINHKWGETFSSAQRIKATLPPESLKYLENLEQTLHIDIKPYKPYAKFREILNRVNDAVVKRKTLEIVYYTMSRKRETRRKVDPYRMWFFNGTFYIIGFCHMRHEIRIFALDRIKLLPRDKGDI